jgi:prepilin-type processing-associated H-X9-DG protein
MSFREIKPMIAACRICLSLLILAVFGRCVSAEIHTWTDSTGKFKTEAEFVSLTDGKVTLRKTNGKNITLPLERLSKKDQLLAQEQARLPKPSSRPPAPTQAPNNVINSVRGAVYRVQTLNNMKQIALAMANYESTRGRFPAAAIMTADRKPGLSWRVAILPDLGENNLHKQFRLDEPWDSPRNKALVERMPKVFQSPGSSLDRGYTNYLAVRLPNAIIADGPKGIRIGDVRDGTANTVSFLEVDDDHAAIWTKPDDYQWDEERPLAGIGNIWSGRFYAAFADGHVDMVLTSTPPETLGALFTRNGGERLQLPRR